MTKGDIVLVKFPFTNFSGSKLRPAVILFETPLDFTVCFITSQLSWEENTDVILFPTIANGLKLQSLIRTSKIATIDKQFVKGLLGKLVEEELFNLDKNLKKLLQL